jgi:phage terminase large subunit
MRNLGWQTSPRHDIAPVVLLTGSAGGGKSRIAAQKLHDFCLRYRGATALVVRKARVSITNSTAEFFVQSVIGGDPRVRHVPSKSRFEYANGSRLIYTGLDDEEQRKRIRSIGGKGGIDIVWMEEATEFEEDDYNAVLARLRGAAAHWRQIILTTNPDAPTHWIKRRLIDGGEARVYYSTAEDNVYNPLDYRARLNSLTGVEGDRLARGQWVQASGLVYDVWSDGPADGNVTEEAEYVPDGGSIYWACDDGYAGERDPSSGHFSGDSHPRVFLLVQERADGRLCVFAEDYRVRALSDGHIADIAALDYPAPDYVALDSSAAELRGRIQQAGYYTRGKPSRVDESIKATRRMLAPDANGVRRILVHPRCKHLRAELASYRYDPQSGAPIKQFDHGPDALRYLAWTKRLEG